jgi:membrane associated rhomboid family serine protease
MGIYDRDYTQPESRRQDYSLSQMRFNLPRMTPAVQWLLIINVGVFVLSLVPTLGVLLASWFALDATSWTTIAQPWRLVTYQFLHSRTDATHIFLNMIGLYFIGPPLERSWGAKRFVLFYLGCGVAGGLTYILLVAAGWLTAGTMVGASGAVLGVVAACAVLFPRFTLILFVFPVPIRVAAVGLMLVYLVNLLTPFGHGGGGDAAHLGGMAAGLGYVLLVPAWDRLTLKMRSGSWEKKMEESQRLQIEVDRILAKVHRSGLHSLTRREKTTLKRATQEENRRHQL